MPAFDPRFEAQLARVRSDDWLRARAQAAAEMTAEERLQTAYHLCREAGAMLARQPPQIVAAVEAARGPAAAMTAPRDPAAAAARVAASLDEAGIDYAIGGALALAAHAMPRATVDATIGAFVERARLDELFDALDRAGCLYERERARRDVEHSYLFVVRCAGVLVDIFVSDPQHWSVERRVQFPGPDGRPLWFFSAEDWAVHKLALHRAQDVADLERLFAVLGERLDLAYIRRWLEAIAPDPADPRRATLEGLTARFVR